VTLLSFLVLKLLPLPFSLPLLLLLLKGEKFAHEFRAVMEYFKPKQQRKEIVNEEDRVFTVNLRPAKKKK